MINEEIHKIFRPYNADEWYVIETNKGYYNLTLGGFRKREKIIQDSFECLKSFCYKVLINSVLTDDEYIYFFLSNNIVIVHGINSIISNDFYISILTKHEFIKKYGSNFNQLEDIKQLNVDKEGNSVWKINGTEVD